MTDVVRKSDTVVPVPVLALDKVREVLRAVAAGDPVDTPQAAALAAYALAALPPQHRLEQRVA